MEIEELLKTEDAQTAIKAAAKAIAEEEAKGLKSKNTELLGKLKTFQDQLDEIKTAKEEADALAAEKSGDIEKIKETLKNQYTKQIDTLQAQLQDKDGKLHGLLVDNGLTDSLSKAGVAPQHLDVVKAYIKSQNKAEITEIDGKVVAQLNGVPLTDFVTQWAQGDQGKHYIAAPQNSGGGANGANGSGKATSGLKKAEMTVKDKTAYIREHGQEAYNKLQ